MSALIDYAGIKALAKELGRPAGTLVALSRTNDPFYISPSREAEARWAAEQLVRLKIPIGSHYRKIHYIIVSQPEPILRVDGSPYENTVNCWAYLCLALKDADYLGLVPKDAYTDNRNDEPELHQVEPEDAEVTIKNCAPGLAGELHMPELPRLALERPTVPQPYQVELWCEKTTINDLLRSLAKQYQGNIVTASGEITAIRVREFVDRIEEHDRPTRVIYISDFDPAGRSIPLAAARKIEFELYRRGISLDVQLRPIALTPEQCIEYKLPRTPIKETEKRAEAFEKRFGEGATELDALEALHPGTLRRILTKEIERYVNPDHDTAVTETCCGIEEQLAEITADAVERHRCELDALSDLYGQVAHDLQALRELAGPMWRTIQRRLDKRQPDLDDIEWCPPFDADDDPDPLYCSSRDYVEQIDRYKQHQDKPTERQDLVREVVCSECGRTFEARRAQATLCSSTCRARKTRRRDAESHQRARDRRNTSDDPHAEPAMCCMAPEVPSP
jgi:hypothetical protein